ncbi:transcription antiterminator [Caldibacillus thermoamylovorans]|uniref:BglG family transcription antiterminator n=1 Tax=Caldibacillus thermoamylovorans TaxID=35841 RepID=UPI001D05EBF8|nr:transcription antiterminator [Caldibacillus thermoamylovorans]MCB5935463.1 transcription antiterminator [Bacillus sp. DFI.2.34]MCB7076392.1 transcription antiterminator [Caldibacillus thermoamylovorans]
MLSEREYKILLKLLKFTQPIRIKDLSREFNVSPRMIKYDLDHIKDWLAKYELQIFSQTNKGLWIEPDGQKKKIIIKELLGNESWNRIPDQNFRIKKIVMTMLQKDDYTTAASLSEILEVSRNTILSDMKLVEEFVSPWEIQLERKKRIGYRLSGEELHLRLLIENLILSNMSNYEIYQIMSSISNKEERNYTIYSVDGTLLSVFRIAEEKLSELYHPSVIKILHQSDILTLLIRITISVTRLNQGKTIKSYRVLKDNQYTDDVSRFILNFMRSVFKTVDLPILEDEFLYLSGEFANGRRVDLLNATQKIIEEVSYKAGIDFKRDTKLFSNLFAHLSLRFQRGLFNMTESNPFAEEIKQNYADLFESVSLACEKYLGMDKIVNKNEFISFITLHFLTSLENTFNKKEKVRAVYVCATGKGVARLIKSRVEKEIHDIDIVAYCSIMEVEEICKKREVDLIISVFPIKSRIPVIVMEAIPTKKDIDTIKEKVYEILENRPKSIQRIAWKEEEKNDEDSESISLEIILKGFEVIQEVQSNFAHRIKDDRLQALHLHIFLMVHRYFFEKQYDDFLYTSHQVTEKNKQDLQLFKNILESKDLHVNDSELIALLQYLN